MSRHSAGNPVPAAPHKPSRRHGLLGGTLAMGFAIVAGACGPLQQPAPETRSAAAVQVPATDTTVTAPRVASRPRRMALLLPLSGSQRAVAEAVRDGFMAAYLADSANAGRPELIVLDEQQPGADEAYRTATAAADIVVGPLLKESVTQIAAQAGAVSTLALNFTEDSTPTAERFYQFALAPEDEARQVAERAVSEGRTRAIALVPDNDWGRRMLAAFTPALEALGGTVIAQSLYDPAATDVTAQLERLLLIDESRARHRQLVANLGIPLEFEPRRRLDVDFIFLAANVASGRLIRPQLRFVYAGDLPTYATSAIYQPGSSGDADLDGVMFLDAPILLMPDERAQAIKAAISRHWPPGSAGRLRFFAMGFDAYGLASALGSDALDSAAGLSGMLSLDPQRRVHRRMPWAEFRGDRIALLPHVPPAELAPATAQP